MIMFSKCLLVTMFIINFKSLATGFCDMEDEKCSDVINDSASKYSKQANEEWINYLSAIDNALKEYEPCVQKNCSCHSSVIQKNLSEFKNGITRSMIKAAQSRGTKYQIIDHRLYRDEACMFPSRCAGVEHFILDIIDKLPNLEFILNTRDWPQVSRYHNQIQPVFSFSKTSEYYDILYPAWSFWEGGPAIKLYPQGLGRWDWHREALRKSAEKWPWDKKKSIGFFRGSRTTEERDALIFLSRDHPDLIDAQYTKNQAWRSDADTLHAPPAEEVHLEDHCQYKYLFNFRGVAASFRLKHLFLCQSLVFHVGHEWIEFFYPALKPWVHYIPIKTRANKEEIKQLINFVKDNDTIAREIANRGYDFIWNHLRMKDVSCYWKKLLKKYAKLLKYTPTVDSSLIEIKRRT